MTIFLIDDDDVFNYLHESVIKSLLPHAQVTVFKSGLDFLTYVQNNGSASVNPEAVFLDIRMPDMDGFSLLEELEKWPVNPLNNSRVFMLSSTLDERDLEKARSFKSVTDFIGKPLTIELCSKLLTNKN